MNELLLNAIDPLYQWFMALGDIGIVLWTVIKILLIAMSGPIQCQCSDG